MPIASLREVLDGLRDQIEAAVAGNGVDVQVYGRIVTRPSTPTIDMFLADPPSDPETAAFNDILGGDLITVRARVDTNDHESNQDVLIDLMDQYSDLSVAAAIMDDPTLGGLANLDIRGNTGMREYLALSGELLAMGAEWTVLALRIES